MELRNRKQLTIVRSLPLRKVSAVGKSTSPHLGCYRPDWDWHFLTYHSRHHHCGLNHYQSSPLCIIAYSTKRRCQRNISISVIVGVTRQHSESSLSPRLCSPRVHTHCQVYLSCTTPQGFLHEARTNGQVRPLIPLVIGVQGDTGSAE